MKKILILETHYRRDNKDRTSGVDYVRLVLPGTYLSKEKGFEVSIRKDPFDGYKEKNWDELTSYYDAIWTSYVDNELGYVQMAVYAHKNNCAIISDVDDHMWKIPRVNPVYQAYHPGSKKLHDLSCILEDVDYITTSNNYLKYRISEYTGQSKDRIYSIPNYIDLSLFDHKKITKKKDDVVTIVHAGTTTHHLDLVYPPFMKALLRVMKEYPNTEFMTVGNFVPQYVTALGKRYKMRQGDPDLFSYADKLWPEIMGLADIFVIPLDVNEFTRSKSDIKMWETMAGKVPAVYQDIRQYSEHLLYNEDRGLLARDEESWYRNLKNLVESETLRNSIADAGFAYVQKEGTIQNNIHVHKAMFEAVSRKN